jgi:hypothetical protein
LTQGHEKYLEKQLKREDFQRDDLWEDGEEDYRRW